MEMEMESGKSGKGSLHLNPGPNSNMSTIPAVGMGISFPTNDKYIFGFERQPGLKESVESGFYGLKTKHILTYDASLVRPVLVAFTDREITVCNSVNIWIYHIGFLVYAIVLMFLLGYNAYPDGTMGETGACSDDNTHKNVNMCQLDNVLNDAKSDFRFLIAFLLAGFVAISVSQWNLRRQNYAALCGKAMFIF